MTARTLSRNSVWMNPQTWGRKTALALALVAITAVGVAGGRVAEIVVVLDGNALIDQRGIHRRNALLFRPARLHRGVKRLIVEKFRALSPRDDVAACAVRRSRLFHQHAFACEIVQ